MWAVKAKEKRFQVNSIKQGTDNIMLFKWYIEGFKNLYLQCIQEMSQRSWILKMDPNYLEPPFLVLDWIWRFHFKVFVYEISSRSRGSSNRVRSNAVLILFVRAFLTSYGFRQSIFFTLNLEHSFLKLPLHAFLYHKNTENTVNIDIWEINISHTLGSPFEPCLMFKLSPISFNLLLLVACETSQKLWKNTKYWPYYIHLCITKILKKL